MYYYEGFSVVSKMGLCLERGQYTGFIDSHFVCCS